MSFKNSYFHSWLWARDDFALILPELLGGRAEGSRVIYRTRHKECLLIMPEESGFAYPVVFKRYGEKRFFRYLFRPSLAYREYLGFKAVAEAGIPAAEVLALGEKRSFIRLEEAFFVTRYLEGFRDGYEFCLEGCDEGLRDRFIRRNLELLAKLHGAGLVHGCFHPRNEMFKLSETGEMEVVWIDLASVTKECRGSRFSREEDLGRFLKEFHLGRELESEYEVFYRKESGKY